MEAMKMHLINPFMTKMFKFHNTQSLYQNNIYKKLKKHNVDIKSWEFTIDILSEREFLLYKKATTSIIKDDVNHNLAQNCIYSLIRIINELKKDDIHDCNHCYNFLVELNKFRKVHDKILYMALYKKALSSEMVL